MGMLKAIQEILIHMMTGADNATTDVGRVLWFLSTVVFLGLSVYSVYLGQPWDPSAFGTGLGLVLAGGGAAIGLKAGTEPKCQQ